MLSSHSIVSSSRSVRPCSPWRVQWIGLCRTALSTDCSSAPHSQAAKEAKHRLYKQERKRPTLEWRRLSRTQALLWRVIPRGWLPVSVMRVQSFVGFSAHSAFHWWSDQWAARILLLSDRLKSCCAGCTNECLDLGRRAIAPGGHVSAEWIRCPGSMARRARNNVAPLRRSSVGWMPARIGRLFAGVGRRHPVTIRKVSLMVGSTRLVWSLRHQTGAQYSAVERTRAKVAVCNLVAPVP